MKKTSVCPYCLTKFNKGSVDYFCPSCSTSMKPGYWDIFLNRYPKCNEHGAARRILCPNKECKMNNPESGGLTVSIFDYKKNLTFSILGATGCGKTFFLTAMTKELDKRFNLIPIDKKTEDTYNENCRTIYEDLKIVDSTPTASEGIITPQNWGMNCVRGAYLLSFYDAAGEDCKKFSDTDIISENVKKYLAHTDNVFILIDPLTFRTVKSSITKDEIAYSTIANNTSEDNTSILKGFVKYMREIYGLKPDEKINKNVAIVFTKIGVLKGKGFFDENAEVFKQNMLEIDDYERNMRKELPLINEEIRKLLTNEDEESIIKTAEESFKNYRFFVISSRGLACDGAADKKEIISHRVLDPIMWFFGQEGVIKVK